MIMRPRRRVTILLNIILWFFKRKIAAKFTWKWLSILIPKCIEVNDNQRSRSDSPAEQFLSCAKGSHASERVGERLARITSEVLSVIIIQYRQLCRIQFFSLVQADSASKFMQKKRFLWIRPEQMHVWSSDLYFPPTLPLWWFMLLT